MLIAVEGCAHGELEVIYNVILETEKNTGKKIDLLLCCGDFQAVRNQKDLQCMAVSEKHKDMGTFYKYYSGEKVAPVLTIFIGGNHEASNYLQELAYGGWVAPNIYYLGYASVISVAGIRIAGMSGIYKSHDWLTGHHEYPPYNASTMRSAYHVRNLEVFRLKQLSNNIDIFMSHDWPSGVWKYGNKVALLKQKPFFKDDIEQDCLGSPPAMELLEHHYPNYWFSAHLHCKFVGLIPNKDESKVTKFLALDKCLPKRSFLQMVEIPHDVNLPIKLSYDLEWITILFLTNHLLSISKNITYLPGPNEQGRKNFTPTEEEKNRILSKLKNDLTIPLNFKMTVSPYNQDTPNKSNSKPPRLMINNQTTDFCNNLGIDDPFMMLKLIHGISEDKEDTFETSSSMTTTPSFTTSNYVNSCIDVSLSSDEEPTESFIIDTNPFVTKTSMTPLKLPAPSNDSSNFNEDEKLSTEEKSPKLSRPLSNPSLENSTNATEESNYKKFKRRNESIYSNND